jgi:hypothetical protein
MVAVKILIKKKKMMTMMMTVTAVQMMFQMRKIRVDRLHVDVSCHLQGHRCSV